jgi:pantoate--beta-alanine ligase
MILFKRSAELANHLQIHRSTNLQIGFVPTMGALHEGHLSLIRESNKHCAITVCSIFVNPTQFNDPKDFQKYPVTLEKDIYLLEKNETSILFLPQIEDVYPGGTEELERYDLGYLETILEGKYRPGHFQGVCQVMHRLLKIIQPDCLFMGEKDYQQCMVIKRLLLLLDSGIRFFGCPTLREPDGLAMSSRNMRLDPEQRQKATGIYKALEYLNENIQKKGHQELIGEARSILEKRDFRIDYVEIADADNLLSEQKWDRTQKIIALIAAFQEEIRLIDNMILNCEHN